MIKTQTQLLPCPFCSKGFRINCSGAYEHDSPNCILHGFEICNEKQLEKWNIRKPVERIVEQLENRREDIILDDSIDKKVIMMMFNAELDNHIDIVINGGTK